MQRITFRWELCSVIGGTTNELCRLMKPGPCTLQLLSLGLNGIIWNLFYLCICSLQMRNKQTLTPENEHSIYTYLKQENAKRYQDYKTFNSPLSDEFLYFDEATSLPKCHWTIHFLRRVASQIQCRSRYRPARCHGKRCFGGLLGDSGVKLVKGSATIRLFSSAA